MITIYKDALTINGDNYRPFIKGNKGMVRETYYSPERNNLIVFQPWDKGIDTESIVNSTMPRALEILIGALDHERNIVVLWSKVEGTMSDWVIYHGLNPYEMDIHNHSKCMKVLKQHTPEDACRFKHTIIKDGTFNPLTLQGGVQ